MPSRTNTAPGFRCAGSVGGGDHVGGWCLVWQNWDMCGRYSFSSRSVERLAAELRTAAIAVELVENMAPSRRTPVAVQREGQPRIELMAWGVQPPWQGVPLINARSETAATKPVFRNLFRQRRCLVPADAFYEWQAGTRPKQPWRFSLAGDEPMVIAGLWHDWRDASGQLAEGFLLLTTDANSSVALCHDRMPVLLAPEAWALWLDSTTPAGLLQPLLRSWPGTMYAWPVTTALNRAGFDGAVTRVAPPPSQAELF
jgi:putative SOS response-associated peptidase YedK